MAPIFSGRVSVHSINQLVDARASNENGDMWVQAVLFP